MANKTFQIGKGSISFEGQFNGITLLGIGISANSDGNEDDLRFALHIFSFSVFISIFSPALNWIYKKLGIRSADYGRNIGFGISKGGVFNIDCFGAKWKEITKTNESKPLFYLDLGEFMGNDVYSEEHLEDGEFLIEMPEADYKAKYEKVKSTWKRKFWFKTVILRIKINMIDEIPAPVETIKGVVMPYTDDQEMVDIKMVFINSINHHRVKAGGKDWKPNQKKK